MMRLFLRTVKIIAALGVTVMLSSVGITLAQSLNEDRIALDVPKPIQNEIKAAMRGILQVFETMMDSLAEDNYDNVEKSALSAGLVEASQHPDVVLYMSTHHKEFILTGMAMHAQMDKIARVARITRDKNAVLGEISTLFSHCNGCHSTLYFK